MASLRQNRSLASLPLELQLQILSHLPYPDLLALKLTSRYFHTLAGLSTTVIARVTWLLSRAQTNLPIPKSGQLRLRTDADFVRNKEVQRILRARRRHEECAEVWRELGAGEKWPGCLVVPGVEMCEKGLEVLEAAGGRRPVWTCGGDVVYVSRRMEREARGFAGRAMPGRLERGSEWVVEKSRTAYRRAMQYGSLEWWLVWVMLPLVLIHFTMGLVGVTAH